MRSISDILADPNGGSGMSASILCALILLAGVFGATSAAYGLIEGRPDWWMGMPLAIIALPEGIKLLRNWRRRDAR